MTRTNKYKKQILIKINKKNQYKYKKQILINKQIKKQILTKNKHKKKQI